MLFQVLFSLATLSSFVKANCLHGTSLFPRSINEDGMVKVSTFGYTALKGPLNWSNLDAKNKVCDTGKRQSPINIDSSIPRILNTPIFRFPHVKSAEVENIGTTIETIVEGSTIINGETFNLKQFHLHTPSEHRINEEYFPLEMHMVHESANNSIAVISVLFQLRPDGRTTNLLTSVTRNLRRIVRPGQITESGHLNFWPLIKHLTTSPLLVYDGSLTTPPCTEGVQFIVAKRPLPVNVVTYNALKRVIKFNSRYTQNTLGQPNLLSLN